MADLDFFEDKLDETEQLMVLRDFTQKTGVLHEAQVMHLKYWFLMLTNATDFEIEFQPDSSKVIYRVLKTKGKKPENYNKNLNQLSEYVKFLLGTRYSTVVEDKICQKKKKPSSHSKKKR